MLSGRISSRPLLHAKHRSMYVVANATSSAAAVAKWKNMHGIRNGAAVTQHISQQQHQRQPQLSSFSTWNSSLKYRAMRSRLWDEKDDSGNNNNDDAEGRGNLFTHTHIPFQRSLFCYITIHRCCCSINRIFLRKKKLTNLRNKHHTTNIYRRRYS